MPVSSVLNEEMLEVAQPDEDRFLSRKGWDTKGLRREIAPITPVDLDQKYVSEGDTVYVDPRSTYNDTPTGIGETYGQVDIVQELGGKTEIFRYTNGYTVNIEGGSADPQYVADAREAVLEFFDILADANFLTGVTDEQGNTVRKGVFTWLDDNIPSSNTIDCSTLTVSSDLNGVPANIMNHIYSKIDGVYSTGEWDLMLGQPNTLASMTFRDTNDGADITNHWELMQPENNGGIGVNRTLSIPKKIELASPPSMDEKISIDLSGVVPSDTVYIIPDHGGDFYEVYEMGRPEILDPIRTEGGKERIEYIWKQGHVFNNSAEAREEGQATDAFKLTNFSSLFDGS